MNTEVVTTGLVPLCLGSQETFELRPTLGEIPWDLTGGSATLRLADPTGNVIFVVASVQGASARAPWTVAGATGAWTRAWDVTDGTGLRQVSRPIPFKVISSPV